MKKALILQLIFLMLPVLLFSFNQEDTLARIQKVDEIIDNEITPWKVGDGHISGAELPDFDDSDWRTIIPVPNRRSPMIRKKVFWLCQEYRVPEAFSGIRIQGSRIDLDCRFRGLGMVKGKYYVNGELRETFELEFGNHTSEIKKTFPLSHSARPGTRYLVAFLFSNLGKLPLIDRDEYESGTFFQLLEARVDIEKAQEARDLLHRFLLDLKIGARLLSFIEPTPRRPQKVENVAERPISEDYKRLLASDLFQNLRERFERAVIDFDVEALTNGDFPTVKLSLKKFYHAILPVSDFAKKYTIHTGGNSHIDLAWTWRWRETVEIARATFSTILDNMDEYPGIVFIQSQAQIYKWMEEYYPEVFRRIKKQVQEGRWEIVGGMWAQSDTNLVDGESFIRQILYGKKYFQDKFGVDVKIGWLPDTFGYSWNLPQFFKKSGIDAFICQKLIHRNDTTRFPYLLFLWEGVDGSRILTYFPPNGYQGWFDPERMVNGLKVFEKNTGKKDIFILYGLGDHGGGPNREMLNRGQRLEKQALFPVIEHGSLSDYMRKIRKESGKGLPVWKDELYLEFHRGTYTTQAKTKKFNRKSEILLSNAEKLSSLAYLFGQKYPLQEMKAAWEKVLMNQFHDILPGASITPVYRDAKEDYLWVQKIVEGKLFDSMQYLARTIDTSSVKQGVPVLVFNPLSWERKGVVRLDLPDNMQDGAAVFDLSGQEIPSQTITRNGGKILVFVAEEIPPMGYRLYNVQKGIQGHYESELKVTDNKLENHYFEVHLDPQTGNIIRIFDKLEKKEVLTHSAQANQLQLFEDIPDERDAWNIGFTGRTWMLNKADKVSIGKSGPVMVSLRIEKSYLGLSKNRREPTFDFPSSFFSQEIILYRGIPRIDIHMNADWWEDHVLLKVAFPVDVRNNSATYEIPFAYVQRPTSRNTDREKARYEVSAIRWADLSDEKYGVSLLNESKYGYDIKDNVMRLTLLRSPLSPDPMADRGKHTFAYSVYPHVGDWKEANTVRRGYEFNVPLKAFVVSSHTGELPPAYSFFSAFPDNIILATVKKAEERQGLIFRLYESEGSQTKAMLRFFKMPKKAYELDLMENRLHPLSFDEKGISLNFNKSEIKTIELVY